MRNYLLVSRAPGDEAARHLAAELAQDASRNGLIVNELNPHTWLAVRAPATSTPLRVGAWTLLGDVFNRRSPILPATSAADPRDYERKLVARFWGRYIGVLFDRHDQPSALLRDPSGAIECVTWSQAGLTLVCSAAPDWLIRRLAPPWRISVDRLAQALHSMVTGTGQLILDGPVALEPGTVQVLPPTRPAEVVWAPAEIARRSLAPPPSAEIAMNRLRFAIDEAVDGLASLPGPLAAEVSGGLDSSIVASCLVRHGPGTVRLWLNAYGATRESDERDFVAILGQALGFEPLCAPHATGLMTSDWLDILSGDLRPGVNGLDYPQDVVWGSHITESGAGAVMSGKGGDSILFQAASTDVFTDLWQARGWRALIHPDIAELAAANEVSVWSMIALARRHRRDGHRPLQREHPMLAPLQGDFALHPWLADLDDFGPGKAFQIAGVADSVSHHSSSALTRSIDVRHPLCAQPVIEACLALPTPLLAIGGRDRGLARRAFRDRLPAAIAERRSKGEMTRIYARLIVDNLDVLRPWLIEGRLAQLGLIDRAAAEAELTPEALIWRGQHAFILTAAALEGWTRMWEGRLGPAR